MGREIVSCRPDRFDPQKALDRTRASLLRQIYASEIERQSTFGVLALADLEQAIAERDVTRVWFSIQALLGAAGNVSKLFWPQPDEDQERGALLREVFEMPDDSPLAKRTLRNHFEHFADRIDQWAKSAGPTYIDANIGPMGGLPTEAMRHFDPEKFVVSFRGDLFELRPLITELARVHGIAAIEKRPVWDRPTRHPMSPAPFPKEETK